MKYDSYLHLLTCWEQKKDEQTAAERQIKKVGSISHKTFQVWDVNVYVTRNSVKEVKAKDSGKVSNYLSCASGLLVMLIWKARKCCKLVLSIQDFDKNCLVP